MLPIHFKMIERVLRDEGYQVELLQTTGSKIAPVSYTHLRAHETSAHLVCRLLLEKKNFFNDTATTEIYTRKIVGSVRCV